MKTLTTALSLLLACFAWSGEPPVNVYFFVDDFSTSKESLESLAEEVYLSKEAKKLKLNSFSVYHSVIQTAFPGKWDNDKGKIVEYFPTKIDCDYSYCESLGLFINDKKTERTKLFVGGGEFECEVNSIGVEFSRMQLSAESIKSKIEEEKIINKSLGKEMTLIFYFPSQSGIEPPTIEFSKTDYEIFEEETMSFEVNVEGATEYKWTPSTGLSCIDCPNPSAAPMENTSYTLEVKNILGCSSTSQPVNVEVKRRCPGHDPVRILYTSDDELYRKVFGNENKWLIASDQPGSRIYYLVCTKNCCNIFNVELYDLEGIRVWNQVYDLETVEYNPKLSEDHPDTFIFKIDLETVMNFSSRDFYRFKISSECEDGNTVKSFQSPPSKFVDCGFVE